MITMYQTGRYCFSNMIRQPFIIHIIEEPVQDLEYRTYEDFVLDSIVGILNPKSEEDSMD